MDKEFSEKEVAEQKWGFEHGGAPSPDSGLKWVRTAENLYHQLAAVRNKDAERKIRDLEDKLKIATENADIFKEGHDEIRKLRQAELNAIAAVGKMLLRDIPRVEACDRD